jgi:formyltetrahydrofolate-dependent phosphoribosylglycinamide formyltransferase
MSLADTPFTKFRIAILLSGKHGRGSNMAALYDAVKAGAVPDASIVQVIGTHAESPALLRARDLGLEVDVIDTKSADFEKNLVRALSRTRPDVICLAGFMRKIPAEIVEQYRHRILNIHPGLLPSFAGKGMFGLHVHQAVLDYGAKITGCTVHLIDEEYDTGPIILQKSVPVHEGDTAETLAARVIVAEHQAYPEALRLMAEGRVSVDGRIVHIREN